MKATLPVRAASSRSLVGVERGARGRASTQLLRGGFPVPIAGRNDEDLTGKDPVRVVDQLAVCGKDRLIFDAAAVVAPRDTPKIVAAPDNDIARGGCERCLRCL